MNEQVFNTERKFVRVMRTLPNGMIEFVFAIGDLDTAVELIMPKEAFDEFCAKNAVEFVVEEQAPVDAEAADADFHWDLHQATHQRFR